MRKIRALLHKSAKDLDARLKHGLSKKVGAHFFQAMPKCGAARSKFRIRQRGL
jgi:hypothetical protein